MNQMGVETFPTDAKSLLLLLKHDTSEVDEDNIKLFINGDDEKE